MFVYHRYTLSLDLYFILFIVIDVLSSLFSQLPNVVFITLFCSSFGYAVTPDSFGAGNGQIWLDQVDCSGAETDISQCSHLGWGVNNCNHQEDVGIVCITTAGKSDNVGISFSKYYTVMTNEFPISVAKKRTHFLGVYL